MSLQLEPLRTPRLRLEPITLETARAILAGDLSGLNCAEGWPHEDTTDGLGMAIKGGQPPSWLIVADGAIIGDAGLHGPVDEAGRAEIGYGLAAPWRGQGYGSEAVAAITEWLLTVPGVREVRAHTLTDNMPSRRVLEKAGFQYAGIDDEEALYQRFPPAG